MTNSKSSQLASWACEAYLCEDIHWISMTPDANLFVATYDIISGLGYMTLLEVSLSHVYLCCPMIMRNK